MPTAGEYRDRLEWLKKGGRVPDGFGQPTDSFPSQGYLWGVIEDLGGAREGAQGTERETISATIRLRNYPAVAAGDRLRSPQWGEIWTVGSVVRGDNEVLCDVTRPRFTAGGGRVG